MKRRLVTAGAALTLVATTGGCSVVPGGFGGPHTYKMTAYFTKTPSLYRDSRVRVMGADVGVVKSIKVDHGRVRVDFTVDSDVPLPADVQAGIVSANTIGERYIALHPAWKPGKAKAAAGSVIPPERTDLPVEIDEALAAFTKLNQAIDPKALRGATESGADTLRGHGEDINGAIQSTARLTNNLAGQDQRLIRLAGNLRTLAAQLNSKDVQLADTIEGFSSAGAMLAEERTRLKEFLAGLAAVIEKSGTVITSFQETLPGTLSDMSNIVMTLKSNSESLTRVVTALGQFGDVLIDAWDKKHHVARIRLALHATVRAWLQPLFDAMGWGQVPCVEGNPELADCTSPAQTKKAGS